MVDLANPDIRRLTVDEVRAMYETGVLGEDERVELEDGVLFRMAPIGMGHSWSLKWLMKRFVVASVDMAWEVAIQDQLNFPGGYRHPDVIVAPILPYGQQPETALLIVEVADSSRLRDREKALRYAQLAGSAAAVRAPWSIEHAHTTHSIDQRPPGVRAPAGAERSTPI